ncbi:33433_t:CDS:2, partial [Racocetra persica]
FFKENTKIIRIEGEQEYPIIKEDPITVSYREWKKIVEECKRKTDLKTIIFVDTSTNYLFLVNHVAEMGVTIPTADEVLVNNIHFEIDLMSHKDTGSAQMISI